MFVCVHGCGVERRIWEVCGRRDLGMLEGLHAGVCAPVAAALREGKGTLGEWLIWNRGREM